MPCFVAGALCLDFSNSITGLLKNGYGSPVEPYARVAAWCGEVGALAPERADSLIATAGLSPRRAGAVNRRARDLGHAIEGIFRAQAENRPLPADHLVALNREVSRAMKETRIVLEEDGVDWGWADRPAALDQFLWPVARSAAELLVSPDRDRVRVCAQDTCNWLFVDASKNHRRRWCDMKVCGNRAKVRRFRSKQGD